MCFLMVHGVLGADFLSSLKIFFLEKWKSGQKIRGEDSLNQ